jgi:hypothetical protein
MWASNKYELQLERYQASKKRAGNLDEKYRQLTARSRSIDGRAYPSATVGYGYGDYGTPISLRSLCTCLQKHA